VGVIDHDLPAVAQDLAAHPWRLLGPLRLGLLGRVARRDRIGRRAVGDLRDLLVGRRVEHPDPAVLRPLTPLPTDQQLRTHAADCTRWCFRRPLDAHVHSEFDRGTTTRLPTPSTWCDALPCPILAGWRGLTPT